ncbi:MAG TPA: AAA family ATPase [Anaerolineae bacterium]|nr:AAA family ATPase [Anaerolineae bacterium]
MAKDRLDRLAERQARELILEEAGHRRSEAYVTGLCTAVEQGAEGSDFWKIRVALQLMGALSRDQRAGVIRETLKEVDPEERAHFLSVEEVGKTLGDLEWVWPSWLVAGTVAFIGGEKGTGKSHAIFRMFATLQGVTPLWPDGTEYQGEPLQIAFIDCEARWQLNSQRMKQLGLRTGEIVSSVQAPPEGELPRLKQWIDDDLFAAVEAFARGGIKVIVIDGFGAGLMDEENKAQYVSGILTRFQEIASLHGALIIITHHLRKKSESIFFQGRFDPPAIQEFRGSSQIISIPITLMVTDKNADHQKKSRLTLRESNAAGMSWHESSPDEFCVGLNFRATTPEEFVKVSSPPHPTTPLDSRANVQEKILKVLAGGGGMRHSDLAKHPDLASHASSLGNSLQSLVRRGKICRLKGEYSVTGEEL